MTRRIAPCSTYKIFSALNALEQGVITPSDFFAVNLQNDSHTDGAAAMQVTGAIFKSMDIDLSIS